MNCQLVDVDSAMTIFSGIMTEFRFYRFNNPQTIPELILNGANL